ncbi:MAG: calcium/proton exchanger [Actinomycetes bacterium]
MSDMVAEDELPSGLMPKWVVPLVVALPLAVGLHLAGASQVAVFIAAALALIPGSAVMGRATEHLSARSGPGVGGLMNVTFGNAPELIIALVALSQGFQEVVKASLVGSVLGNVLLVLGASMLAGGLRPDLRSGEQRFNRTSASAQSGMLLLAVGALVMPAVWELVNANGLGLPTVGVDNLNKAVDFHGGPVQTLTTVVAVILILTYAAGLVFSLRTHKDIFNPAQGHVKGAWTVGKSVAMLCIAGGLVAWMSEILVGSLEEAAKAMGASEFFIGIVVVAIVGNAAEHWVAVAVARKDQMSLAINISVGSAAQIALFVTPVIALASLVIGDFPMALVFNGYELAALLIATVVAGFVTARGRSTWFEGLQLIALYVVFGVTFWLA